MFKTELHCHSNDVSECARVDVNTIIDKYTKGGYSSLVLANHFNAGTYAFLKCTDWQDWVDKYINGYKKLRDAAQGKLNILLGMELRFTENTNDYLVFGVTEEFLRAHPYLYQMRLWEFHKLAKENGMLVVQAHPFRSGMTVCWPDQLDGVEVFNGHMGHDSRNDIALLWAEKFGLIKTSGTDFHYADVPANSGIKTDVEITDMNLLVDILKSGNYELIMG